MNKIVYLYRLYRVPVTCIACIVYLYRLYFFKGYSELSRRNFVARYSLGCADQQSDSWGHGHVTGEWDIS
jgi:hypothetical protein